MRKKIISLILAVLMIVCSLPLSVFASEIAGLVEEAGMPYVTVSTLYYYDEGTSTDYRALPDMQGYFNLYISLNKAPETDEDIVVYYRTVDESAVAAWGDYESVGTIEEAFVTLNKANSYKAKVTVESKVIDYGFYTNDSSGKRQNDKIVTRRFLFELTRVEGNAELHTPNNGERNQSSLYCYLRANVYNYQNPIAEANTGAWQSNMKDSYWADMQKQFDYYWENDPYFGGEYVVQFWDEVNDIWSKGTANVKYTSLYYSLDQASYLNTPHIKYGGTHSDNINLKFDDDWSNYVVSGLCDLGISINGRLTREKWDSDGDATFNLYYDYQGQKRLALTLYLEGEFDDSQFFGWEHAFEYAIEGLTAMDRKDHIDDNFKGFTVYDNNGNVAYQVRKPSDGNVNNVCNQLKQCNKDGYALELMGVYNKLTSYNDSFTAYYLKLPSNFVNADSYSYELILEKDRESEIRWLENVNLSFTLMNTKEPMIAKESNGKQMVTTNLETMREGDPLRMSVRFDRPVFASGSDVYITVDVYTDKGACLAKEMRLNLKRVGEYAWDTLVFEGELPDTVEEVKIGSLRNIKIVDDKAPIKSFFTKFKLITRSISDFYIERDLRTPFATANVISSDNWVKAKSIDLYVNSLLGNSRFNDYVTVYYQWSRSPELPDTYGSKVVFNTAKDGDVLKSIVGTGSGEMYLHLKAVSSYGKSSISDAVTTVYDPNDANATYTPFGPYKFDNVAPELSVSDIIRTGNLRNRTLTIPLPDDNRGVGLMDVTLYYVNKHGEGILLKKFSPDDFKGTPRVLTYTVSHRDVGVGVDADGNLVSARSDVEFYWVLNDKLGNTSGKTAFFTMTFDTNDYLDTTTFTAGPDAEFENATQFIDAEKLLYIYDYSVLPATGVNGAYYGFHFNVDRSKFESKLEGENTPTDKGTYNIKVTYNGSALDASEYECTEIDSNGRITVLFKKQLKSGRYELQLTRSEGGSTRCSMVYSICATNGENDDTAIKDKIENGTLLTNTVYQLSAEYPYFYYKDSEGTRQQTYYNGTKQPATFSTFAKAKEYVYYMELGDIYLVRLTAATANALSSGTTGYIVARGETVTPQEGQYWIRYKSESWTPTAGDSAWVYYYYGMSDVLTEGALSSNLQTALNTVANRITGYGKNVILTDTTLFLGTAMGDKMLDQYGMPYLLEGQIHSADEISATTMSGSTWSVHVCYAADKNIYRSIVYVGTEGTVDYEEYPIVGHFALPEDSYFQYKTYGEYANGAAWKKLALNKGETFINVFTSSGVYYIREISGDGVSVYAIYVDKEAPKVTFSNTDSNGNLKEIPIDGVAVLDIRTKELYIGSISPTEYDRLSYVAVYKVSNFALVGIYTAADLEYSPIKLDDGNYYIVVSDRSGNHYTVTAKVSSTNLECAIKESADKYIRLTCNRRNDQILLYEVYLNGELITSTYSAEQTFDKAGQYWIYIQDIYGNVFSEEYLFTRNYPTVSWKYLGSDGKYHTYSSDNSEGDGFIMTWVSDNSYKISTSVKTRFSFSESYQFEFVGVAPKYTVTSGTETVVTIDAGQSFTLKVSYKNHKDNYTVYTGIVDVTPPSISVFAEVDVLRNGEDSLFDQWLQNGAVTMNNIYYVLSEIGRRNVSNGATVSSDNIKINASDANGISRIDVYLDGLLIKHQDTQTGFSEITVSKWGKYLIVVKDALGNVSEYSFTNGKPDGVVYSVDGASKELDLHGYLNFNTDNVYTKIDYGNTEFKLNVNRDADIFMSVGLSGAATEIYGFRIESGCIYPISYQIVTGNNNVKSVELVVGEAILDIASRDLKFNTDYLISRDGAYEVYASISSDKTVSIKVYAPTDPSLTVSVNARVEFVGLNIVFASSELSRKSPYVSFKDIEENVINGAGSGYDLHANVGFYIDTSLFAGERISSISLYYSKLNDLDASKLTGRDDIYTAGALYEDEGFYLIIVRNTYGNEVIYRLAVSRTFGITSSVTFDDGYKIYYSLDYEGKLYSNHQVTLDVLDENVTFAVTRNGAEYSAFEKSKQNGVTYLIFSTEGTYEIVLTDSFGNVITRRFEINKSSFTVSGDLLTGYNENALKRDEGYTNQKLSVNKAVYDSNGIHYLAVRYGESLTVLFDAFAERPVTTDVKDLNNVIGTMGDGTYTVICRNRYGAVVAIEIRYRGTPTLTLERTTRSSSSSEAYDLGSALLLGFWSNNTLTFRTDAKEYVFTVNGIATECPKTILFENAGDFGSYEYDITYVDEYGFEYHFKAYLVRNNVTVNLASSITGVEINGILNTKNAIVVTFGENIYATYTRNNGEEIVYRSGDVLEKDGVYRFNVIDYAGNASTLTVKKDTAVEFSVTESVSGATVISGGVVNASKVEINALNKDDVYIEKILKNGVLQTDFEGTKVEGDGKWELILSDQLGNKAYFCFYVITRAQNGFEYTTPYEYIITDVWYDSGDGIKISQMNFVNHSPNSSSFNFRENGKYTVEMTSTVTGISSTFDFTVNTNAPTATLVGCNVGETTINDVSVTGCQIGDRIKIYKVTDSGEVLVSEIEVTNASTKMPTVTEGGKYRIVVESEAGVTTELTFVRKHVMNTAGSVFIMIIIGVSVIGLFTGLVYRNKSKTDD